MVVSSYPGNFMVSGGFYSGW